MITKEQIILYLKEIKPSLNSSYNISKVGIFGSYSKNEATENSDIDIIIEFKNDDVDVEKARDYIKMLVEKKFNKRVDVATEKYLFPLFKDKILNNTIYA